MSNLPITHGVNAPNIELPRWYINEKIARARSAGAKIEDLFLIIPISERDGEGEIFLETAFGKLRTFYCKQLSEFQKYGREIPKALLLHKSKYNYPKISKVSTKHLA